MRLFVGVALVAFSLAGTASALQNQTTNAPVVRYESVDTPDQMRTGGAQNPNEVVCRTITSTGSRLGGRRTCRTRAEWEAIARQARDAAEESTRRGLTQTQRG